ncbi:TRAP transporter substrate-binding protein [Falsigemmobacter intermedius]|uniref:TRAP transporter substrate-binding protein n=1 Tax=Falsigemmobacter intermedius TaxID=1553448 RepID=UPI003F0AA131
MMKKSVLTAVACLMLATPGSAQTMRMIQSWNETNVMAYMPALEFKRNLEETGSGIELEIFGTETVPAYEQLTPTQDGVFDFIYTYPTYHSKALNIATSAMAPDMEKIRSSGVFGFMDSYFQKEHNLKLLASVAVGTSGIHCYLRSPLSENSDWTGRKIRGVSNYVPVIEALGGAAVSTDMGELYSSLERGVVDGACAPQSVFRATRHFEVAKFRTEPTFGQMVSYIAMNLDAWNGLSDDVKAKVEEAAIRTEADTIRIGNEAAEGELKALAEAGVEVTRFSDAAYEKVSKAYAEGVWKVVADCCGQDNSDALRKLAVDAGLSD